MYMGFELIVAVLAFALISIPILAWIVLRRISAADKIKDSKEELRSLENSLSMLIKELQDSVQKALGDMETSADKLSEMIESADDRIRQLQYYYEYGEELRPLVSPQLQPTAISATATPVKTNSAIRHKEVHDLSRKGWSSAQIAKHTGMSTDEVQLIINLMEISSMDAHSQPQQTRQPMV